jgi:hypothetical protein
MGFGGFGPKSTKIDDFGPMGVIMGTHMGYGVTPQSGVMDRTRMGMGMGMGMGVHMGTEMNVMGMKDVRVSVIS